MGTGRRQPAVQLLATHAEGTLHLASEGRVHRLEPGGRASISARDEARVRAHAGGRVRRTTLEDELAPRRGGR